MSATLSEKSTPRFRVAVVGGGAAGTLLALHLCATKGIEVMLFDRHAAFGRGVAYSAQAPWHRLNVPAMKMGGWHEGDTLGFARWLHHERGIPLNECEHHFAERSVYGDWLCSLLQPLVAAGRVSTVAREVVDIEPASQGGVLLLEDGVPISTMTDPVPHALVLTAIVIGFATTALFLVVLLAARGLTGTDHVDGREQPK